MTFETLTIDISMITLKAHMVCNMYLVWACEMPQWLKALNRGA